MPKSTTRTPSGSGRGAKRRATSTPNASSPKKMLPMPAIRMRASVKWEASAAAGALSALLFRPFSDSSSWGAGFMQLPSRHGGRGLANPRQLFACQHGDDAFSADERMHGHHARMIFNHLADDGRVPPQRVGAHHLQKVVSIVRLGYRDQFSLIGNIQRVEPQHLASAAHFGTQRNGGLAQFDTHAGGRRQLVERARHAAARRVAHATDT